MVNSLSLRLLSAALVALLLAVAGPLEAATKTKKKASKPVAVEKAEPAALPAEPRKVVTGIYINDIHELDYRTNSYVADLYVWYRWTDKRSDPIKSAEFMNVFDPGSQQKIVLLDEPKIMPDGSLYNIVRFNSRFSKKFNLEAYPFDRQSLEFILEDSVAPASEQLFVADRTPITINPKLMIPGFRIGEPSFSTQDYVYPTDFGDLAVTVGETYSRFFVSVPIKRPVFTLAIKTFVPILLIVICAALIFYIHPYFVDGRIGLAITALLTLVALQFTTSASLPDGDYFTMLDKVYMLSYAFIITALVRVAWSSWFYSDTHEAVAPELIAADRWWGRMLLVGFSIGTLVVVVWVLLK